MTTVILGGGVSGLSAAYYLRKNLPLHKIIIVESTSRVGGWIKSTIQPNGTIFEQGPRTIRPHGCKGANTLELIESLGLTSSVKPILADHPAASNRMIYAHGRLHSLPNSLMSTFKTQAPFSKPLISYFLQDLRADKTKIAGNDESIYSFVERRFGQEVADYAISPMICGICAGDAKEISVKFLMERLFDNEQRYGGVIKGTLVDLILKRNNEKPVGSALASKASKEKWSIYTLGDGLETLPLKLKNYNRRNSINMLFNKTCRSIEITQNNQINLKCHDDTIINADHLISTIPAYSVGNVLVYHPQLTDLLTSIKYVNVAVVNLYYNSKILYREGFGFLVPPKEKLSILGVIFDSCFLSDNEENTVLTVMMGGHWFREQFGENPSEDFLLKNALQHVNKILDVKEEPTLSQVNILKNCIPQYKVGHNDKVAKINNYIMQKKLPISLCGASYHGVGINDVILSARMAVENMYHKFNN